MPSKMLMLLLFGLTCSTTAQNDDGWNFTPSKGVRSKGDAQLRALAAAIVNDTDPRVPVWWASFKDSFYKTYTSAAAEAVAYQNFKGNLDKVLGINSDLNVPFWATGNFYADYDYAAFRRTFLMTNLNLTKLGGGRRLIEGSPVPESELSSRRKLQGTYVDWRNTGKLTPVKDQGGCGSCWAYAATVTIESSYLINQGLTSEQSRLDLSEQQMIDCVSGSSCNGGSSDSAIRYVNDVYQTTESLYPSTFRDGSCRAGGSPSQGSAVRLAKPTQYPGTFSESLLMKAVSNQPTVIYFEVVDDFYSYSGGTYVPRSCGNSINHAMVAVGYSYTGNPSSSYWIVRNSWGAYWGDNGYVYIQMTGTREGPCGMYQYAYQPTTQFSLTLSITPSPRPAASPSPPPYSIPNSPWAPWAPSSPSTRSPSPPPPAWNPSPSPPPSPRSSPQPPYSTPNSPWAPWAPWTPNTPWMPWAPWAPWSPSVGSSSSPSEIEPPAPSPTLDHRKAASPRLPSNRPPRPPRAPAPPRPSPSQRLRGA